MRSHRIPAAAGVLWRQHCAARRPTESALVFKYVSALVYTFVSTQPVTQFWLPKWGVFGVGRRLFLFTLLWQYLG